MNDNDELSINFVIRDWKTILEVLRRDMHNLRIMQVIENELKLAE